MAVLPEKRHLAINTKVKRYFTGKPCKYGHVCERHTSSGECVECCKARQSQWRKQNSQKAKERDKKYYLKHRDANLKYSRDYRETFPEKCRNSTKLWQSANKHKRAHYERRRQASKLNATPKWLTDDHNLWMDKIYLEAKNLSQKYSADITVDHIFPLQGKSVCGLHVPWNLRLATRRYNSSKRNKIDDVPFIGKNENITIHASALPWNLKETQNANRI